MRDIEKDKEMCEAATAGSWFFQSGGYSKKSLIHTNDDDLIALIVDHSEGDGHFIAESRTALPYWIAQYEAVQKAGRAIVESYERITNDMEDEYKSAQARIAELERKYEELEEQAARWREESGN